MIVRSDLLRRVLAERRSVVLPLAVLALINCGVYVLGVYPLSLKVASAERRLIGLRAQQLAAEREQRSVHAALATTEQAEKDLSRFYRDVLPQDLGGARRQTYARLAALAHEHNLAIERRSYDEHKRDMARTSRLEQLDIKMILKGTYDDVRDFIYALETSSEFVVIEDVGIAQDTQAEGNLRLSLQLTTYFRGAERGD